MGHWEMISPEGKALMNGVKGWNPSGNTWKFPFPFYYGKTQWGGTILSQQTGPHQTLNLLWSWIFGHQDCKKKNTLMMFINQSALCCILFFLKFIAFNSLLSQTLFMTHWVLWSPKQYRQSPLSLAAHWDNRVRPIAEVVTCSDHKLGDSLVVS